MICALPGVTDVIVGARGRMSGVASAVAAAPSPTELCAVTENVYRAPLVKPSMLVI